MQKKKYIICNTLYIKTKKKIKITNIYNNYYIYFTLAIHLIYLICLKRKEIIENKKK